MPSLPPLRNDLKPEEILQRALKASREESRRQWYVIYLLSRADPDDHSRAARIAKEMGCTPQWVRKLAHAYNKRGAKAIDKPMADRSKAGRLGRLTIKEKEKLDQYFVRTRCKCSTKEIQFFIRSMFGKSVHEKTALRYRQAFEKTKLPALREAEILASLTRRQKQITQKKEKKPIRLPEVAEQPEASELTLFDFLPDEKT